MDDPLVGTTIHIAHERFFFLTFPCIFSFLGKCYNNWSFYEEYETKTVSSDMCTLVFYLIFLLPLPT